MQSMTGYGRCTRETGSLQVATRIRSVNHRYLDMVVRIPEEYRSLEIALRERIGNRLNRGRIELRIEIDDRRDRAVRVHVSKSWIAGLARAKRELEEAHVDLGRLRLGDLLRIQDAVRISLETSSEIDEESSNLILTTLDGALDELQAARESEGAKLESLIVERLDALNLQVSAISAAQEEIRKDQAARVRRRIEELLGSSESIDTGRIEQEIAMLAERSDVSEELDRLAAHLQQFRVSMTELGPVGKKLDFIAQEISRELTTLGTKCRQAGVVPGHVEAKLLCEQIREQLQNIE